VPELVCNAVCESNQRHSNDIVLQNVDQCIEKNVAVGDQHYYVEFDLFIQTA